MKIAHLSDLHVLGDDEVPFHRYLNKRITGYVNLKYRRHAVHKRTVVQQLARELRARQVDHVVITGDVSNLALEGEFASVKRLLSEDLGLSPKQVSLIPGNHDLYTRGSAKQKRFASYFGEHLESDVPGVAVDHPSGPFPYVQLRGEAAIIGLSTALPRPPLFASGEVGKKQLEALSRLLAHPEVTSRIPIVLLHHPPHNPTKPVSVLMKGLYDAPALREVLGETKRPLVLHGHLHERMHHRLPTAKGSIESVGATSSSLLDENPARMAGFNWYEIEGGELREPKAFVLDPTDGSFVERSIPLTLPS